MKVINIVITVFMMFVCPVICDAQKSCKLSQLQDTKWVVCYGDTTNVKRIWEFSSKKFRTTTVFKRTNESRTFEYDFYLSKTKPTNFSQDLVGKNGDGAYIVAWLGKEFVCLRIESISNNTLKLFMEKKLGKIGSNSDVTLVLKKNE